MVKMIAGKQYPLPSNAGTGTTDESRKLVTDAQVERLLEDPTPPRAAGQCGDERVTGLLRRRVTMAASVVVEEEVILAEK